MDTKRKTEMIERGAPFAGGCGCPCGQPEGEYIPANDPYKTEGVGAGISGKGRDRIEVDDPYKDGGD